MALTYTVLRQDLAELGFQFAINTFSRSFKSVDVLKANGIAQFNWNGNVSRVAI